MRKFLNKIFNRTAIATGSRRTVGTVSILVGLVGLGVLLFNPMPILKPLLPLH